jgi:hypothetical protein
MRKPPAIVFGLAALAVFAQERGTRRVLAAGSLELFDCGRADSIRRAAQARNCRER